MVDTVVVDPTYVNDKEVIDPTEFDGEQRTSPGTVSTAALAAEARARLARRDEDDAGMYEFDDDEGG